MRRSLAIVAVALAGAAPAAASTPWRTTLRGCVVERVFYSVSGRAYPIQLDDAYDLKPLEGKEVAIDGSLMPSDRFRLEGPPQVEASVCPATSLRLIRLEQASKLGLAATKAAKEGAIARATTLIGQAMSVVAPPECNTFTDRAFVLTAKGDFAAARRDVATVRTVNGCRLDFPVNPLLLANVGEAMLAKGDKPGAVEAYEAALLACNGGDWCRGDLVQALAAAKKK